MEKTGYESWTISDEFWEQIKDLVPVRQRDPNKTCKRKPGAGRKPLEPRRVLEGILLCAMDRSYTPHVRSRGEEKAEKQEGKKARRRVVEVTFSWFKRFRKLLVRWEKKEENYLALLHFACAIIVWRKLLRVHR